MAGEGSEYFGYASKLIEPWMIIYLVASISFMIAALCTWCSPNKRYWSFLLFVPIIVILATHICMDPELHGDSADEWDVWRKPRIVYKNFNDVKATHFEDTELPFAEREHIKEEIERQRKTKPTEKAFIEITDETEPDVSSLNYDNQGFFKLQLLAILTALSNEMAMADGSRKADLSDISTLLTALANKTAAPEGYMKKIIPKDSNLPERLMKASENTNTLQPPTVNPIKHSTTDLVKYPPTKIDKLLAN